MNVDVLLGDDVNLRAAALDRCSSAPDHERFTLASEISTIARRTADALAHADESGGTTAQYAIVLGRAALALSIIRGEVARNTLHRIADERSYAVKAALAKALRETRTAEGRSVLVYLLSDDDAQADAIVAIGAAPWPEILPALIEIAESDDRAARLAARPIARCGATAGPNEANAAANFLLEQLDDEMVVFAAADALVRYGTEFAGVAEKGLRLARQDGRQRIAGLCLVAATTEGVKLEELAGKRREADDASARGFLRPLKDEANPRVRDAAHRTWRALGLRDSP